MDDAADIVEQAEADYSARNLEAAVSMFADDAVIIWNAREVARGKDAVREFHERFFDPAITNLTLKKTLIASSDDAIAVEWFATWVNPDGTERVARIRNNQADKRLNCRIAVRSPLGSQRPSPPLDRVAPRLDAVAAPLPKMLAVLLEAGATGIIAGVR
jgi:uncharacterized protein (TIGR02246 family)